MVLKKTTYVFLVSFKHSQPTFTCSKLTIETVETGVFIVNFEHI